MKCPHDELNDDDNDNEHDHLRYPHQQSNSNVTAMTMVTMTIVVEVLICYNKETNYQLHLIFVRETWALTSDIVKD